LSESSRMCTNSRLLKFTQPDGQAHRGCEDGLELEALLFRVRRAQRCQLQLLAGAAGPAYWRLRAAADAAAAAGVGHAARRPRVSHHHSHREGKWETGCADVASNIESTRKRESEKREHL
jgi:hypothetical protein